MTIANGPGPASWTTEEEDFPLLASPRKRLRFLLRYAILAPSSHNSQPWLFRLVGDDRIDVFADPSRWLRVADSDRRELFLSVGCALENLLIAAEEFGYEPEVEYFPDGERNDRVAIVRLFEGGATSSVRPPALFPAIRRRQTNHQPYSVQPVSPGQLERLAACAVEAGVRIHLSNDTEIKRQAEELVVRADAIEFADPAYREELARWIGEGAFGTPWLFARLGQLAVAYLDLGGSTGKRDSVRLQSAPVLGVISTARDDARSRVMAGQVAERVWLTATHLGLALHPMSGPLQIPGLRARVAELSGAPERHPQFAFRLGHAKPETRRTPRRPVEEVLVP